MATKRTSKKAPAKAGASPKPISRIEILDKLKASPLYPQISKTLNSIPDREDFNDIWLGMTLHHALLGPRPHERLTKSERIKTADRISSLSLELSQLLYRIHGDRDSGRDWPYEFQGMIDWMALSSAVDFKESTGSPTESELAQSLADEDGEAFHATRYGIYHTLIDGMPETLEMLSQAAQRWKESGSQPLAKPNHKNAGRLYFIRAMTDHFVRAHGKPMRELTLNLTSVFFNCDDLDEAALSNLAPVTEKMRRFYEMDKNWRKAKLSQTKRKP